MIWIKITTISTTIITVSLINWTYVVTISFNIFTKSTGHIICIKITEDSYQFFEKLALPRLAVQER